MEGCSLLGECWSAELLRCGVTQGASCVSVLQDPVSASQPFQKAKQQPWIGVKEQAPRVLFALFGCGEWWHRELATTAPCTCKVGAASVHHSYAPETSRSGAGREPGSRESRGIL